MCCPSAEDVPATPADPGGCPEPPGAFVWAEVIGRVSAAVQWARRLAGVALSGIDIHSRAAPLYWSAGHPAAWRLAFVSQAGSFLRENAAVRCPASNAGVPINVEASAKPDACLPAFLRKATQDLRRPGGAPFPFFFFFLSRPG